MRCKALLHKACNRKGVNIGAIFPVFYQKDFNSTGKIEPEKAPKKRGVYEKIFERNNRSRQNGNFNKNYRRETKGLYMNNHKKTARYSNTKAAILQKIHSNFTTIESRVNAEIIRLAVWLSMALEIFQ
jgi:hypothetical protein